MGVGHALAPLAHGLMAALRQAPVLTEGRWELARQVARLERTAEARTAEARTAEARTAEARMAEARMAEARMAELLVEWSVQSVARSELPVG